jgi:hypothetical protein
MRFVTERTTLISAIAFTWLICQPCNAADTAPVRTIMPHCDTPPYGDTQQKYNAYLSMPFEPPGMVAQACDAKFHREGRQEFYALGFTDHDFDRFSTTELAMGYIARLGAQSESKNTKSISVEDFVLDGPDLAGSSQNVSMSGGYISHGGLDYLFASTQAIIMQNNAPGEQPHILLQLDSASRDFRKKLLTCRASPNFQQLGCEVNVRGTATICTVTNAFGTPQEMPCLRVADGR